MISGLPLEKNSGSFNAFENKVTTFEGHTAK